MNLTTQFLFYARHLSLQFTFQTLPLIKQVLPISFLIQILIVTFHFQIQLLTKLYFTQQMLVKFIVILLNYSFLIFLM